MDGTSVSSIVALEHVNTQIPDQQVATLFYVTGLGLTRDPYLMTGLGNMWINVGRNQFHLPTGQPQVLRGRIGLVLPDRAALLKRLAGVQGRLAGTQFALREEAGYIEVTSPWGNQLRCHEPAPRFGAVRLGIPYVEFDVPPAAAGGIARFYREVLEAPADVVEENGGPAAHIGIGPDQSLIFRETDRPLPEYDGHHIQIYVAGFAAARQRLESLGLLSQIEGEHQYRFTDILDLDTRRSLFVVEHEVRSLKHPLYARKLVNRNPDQSNMAYIPGADALGWEQPVGKGTADATER